jgi:hypothetical protein
MTAPRPADPVPAAAPPRRWRWLPPLALAIIGGVAGFRHVQATLPFVTLAPVMLALWLALVGAALGAVAGGIAILRDGPPPLPGNGHSDADVSRQALLGLAALLLVLLAVTLTGLSWWAHGTWPSFLR